METNTAKWLPASRSARALRCVPIIALCALTIPSRSLAALAAVEAGEPAAAAATITDRTAKLASWLSHYFSAAYEHTPALALVVAGAAFSLLLALTGVVIRFVAGLRAASAETMLPQPAAGDRTGFAPPRRVWLETGEQGASRYAIAAEVTRIGREPDNDIRLDTPGADRYHASITRTPELDHYLVALNAEGRGLRVNGETTARRRLRDGDIIDIAGVSLRFRATPL